MADERGTVTLWVLGLCVAVLFLGGLSLDLWRAVGDRRELAGMADAAASAGANGLDENALRAGRLRLDPVRVEALARATLDQFPHARVLDRVDIRVEGIRVVVTLRDHVNFSLLGVFMPGRQFTVEVAAAAQPHENAR
jgi:hypothetical protein